MSNQAVKIVTLGGGTGQAAILRGLKLIRDPEIQITAITPHTDSGGSSERLAREYGVRNLGDLTACMAALCPNDRLGEAMLLRFPDVRERDDGDSAKNLIATLWQKRLGFADTLTFLHELFQLDGHRVLPVSIGERPRLRVRFANNKWFALDESDLDRIAENRLYDQEVHRIEDAELEGETVIYESAAEAISEAGCIVVCPGSLITSITPVLLVVRKLVRPGQDVVMLTNLANKPGETGGFALGDFVEWVDRMLGRPVDSILCNADAVPDTVEAAYRRENQEILYPVDSYIGTYHGRTLYADLWGVDKDGKLRHDPAKTVAAFSLLLGKLP